MYRTLLRAALFIAAATAFVAVAADEGGVDWTKCRGGQGISQDDRIAACSEIIESGKVSGSNLGFAYRFRGDAYQANSNRDLAVASYRQAIEADQASESIYLNSICWTLTTLQGNLDEALRACNRSIQLKANGHNYNSRGLLNLKLVKNNDALRDYDMAIKLNNKSASSLYGRGIAKLRLGLKSEGEDDKRAGVALDGWIMHKFTKWGVQPDGSVG
jgi:tetratricopeptide (TPR) repeat protein